MKNLISNIFIFILLFLQLKSEEYYLDKNYKFEIQKGDSYSLVILQNYIYTNILLYCSLENAMEIIYDAISTPITTQMYVILPKIYEYTITYHITLKSSNKPYFFQNIYIPKELSVNFGRDEYYYHFLMSNDYTFTSGALVFFDARKINKDENIMLSYRHLAGNDAKFLYFPINNEIDLYKLIHYYNYEDYSLNKKIFYPKDDYFVLKVIGSTFAFSVDLFNGNYYTIYTDYKHNTYHLFNNKKYLHNIESSYVTGYRIDYIAGSTDNCIVEIGAYYNESSGEYTLLKELSNSIKRTYIEPLDLYIISKNCDAVITIVPLRNINHDTYEINEKTIYGTFNNRLTLFKIPKKSSNIRTISIDIHRQYKFGNNYPCPHVYLDMITFKDKYIETPTNYIIINKPGGDKIVKFLNPYFFPNPYSNYEEGDEYYIAIDSTCTVYMPEFYAYGTKFDINNDPTYLKVNKLNTLKYNTDFQRNFYSIDSPTKEKSVIALSFSSCNYSFRYNLLYGFNDLIQKNLIDTGYYLYEISEYTNMENLYLFIEGLYNDVLFYYEYLPFFPSYKIQYTSLSKEIKITNDFNKYINIEFYPIIYDEDVEYYLFLSTEDFENICTFYSLSENKYEKNLGIYNIIKNSTNSKDIIKTKMYIGLDIDTKFKVLLKAKTVNNYKIEEFYNSIWFDYSPNNKDKNNSNISNYIIYAIISIIGLIAVVFIIICLVKKFKNNSNDIENFNEQTKGLKVVEV